MNSLLGICIPTYKRPDQLNACLASVLKAVVPHAVSITVLDDSTDNTNAEVKSRLLAAYPHAQWITHTENHGIDRNILASVDACPARYAWLLGEDDRMQPDAVSRMLPLLEQGDPPDFIFSEYCSVDENLDIVLKERTLPFEQNQRMPVDSFFREYAWSMGFLGACIIRREAWSTIDPSPYIGTFFAHVGRIFEMAAGQDVLLSAYPAVLNRCGTPRTFTWIDQTFEVTQGWSRVTPHLVPLYGEEACAASTRSFQRNHGTDTLAFLCYTRADRAYSPAIYDTHIKNSSHGPTYKTLARLIAHTPTWPFRCIRGLLSGYRHLTCPRVPATFRTDRLP